jgi:hypothetical protein
VYVYVCVSLSMCVSRRIHPFELLSQRWTTPTKEADAPNVLATIARFNRASGWVRSLIVSTPVVSERADLMDHLLAIADVRPGP